MEYFDITRKYSCIFAIAYGLAMAGLTFAGKIVLTNTFLWMLICFVTSTFMTLILGIFLLYAEKD